MDSLSNLSSCRGQANVKLVSRIDQIVVLEPWLKRFCDLLLRSVYDQLPSKCWNVAHCDYQENQSASKDQNILKLPTSTPSVIEK